MGEQKIRVLVVEDSLLFRGLLVKYIEKDPELEVVGVAGDPYEARDKIIQCNPDVMTLDIELPKMSGLEFLKKLMPQYPVRTLVISSLSDKVFEALMAGAVDFLAKPLVTDRDGLEEFLCVDLREKIKITAGTRLKKVNPLSGRGVGNSAIVNSPIGNSIAEIAGSTHIKLLKNKESLLVAIGASTGGTEATAEVLKKFGSDMPGIVVTQHMPEGFTAMYANRLNNQMGDKLTVKEASQGEQILPGHVYIAPGGDRHMEVIKKSGAYFIQLIERDKVNGHRPSVEVLFNSVAKAAGNDAVGIILTGMGGDGATGLLKMRERGAGTIGQDESTCVVYGMPRVAFDMGAVEYQEKLGDIPGRTYYLLERIQKRKMREENDA